MRHCRARSSQKARQGERRIQHDARNGCTASNTTLELSSTKQTDGRYAHANDVGNQNPSKPRSGHHPFYSTPDSPSSRPASVIHAVARPPQARPPNRSGMARQHGVNIGQGRHHLKGAKELRPGAERTSCGPKGVYGPFFWCPSRLFVLLWAWLAQVGTM